MNDQRRVVYRDESYTEMWVATRTQAKMFASQLIRDEKPFKVEFTPDGGYTFTVYEENHPSRWEAGA